MKKTISIILVGILIFLTCACSADTSEKMTTEASTAENVAGKTQKKAAATYTGYPALEPVTLTCTDPENSRGLSTEKISHSYGVASNGQPHQISVDSEKFFESKNFRAVTYDASTKEKVLYLTFDCGYDNGYTEKILDTLKEKNVKAAFFCTADELKSAPEVIARMIKEGHIVGNHSTTHPSFDEISRSEMTKEIQDCDNYLRSNFGYTSPYFRFPKGEYSECALELVGSLGYTSVFWSLSYADWDTKAQKGADYAFQKVTARLHPGAVILLHAVSSDNAGAMARIIDYAIEQGYEFKSLDDLPVRVTAE